MMKNVKRPTVRSISRTPEGKDITMFLRYLLAQYVHNFTSYQGRLLKVEFKQRKKRSLVLYTLQAPTAPYDKGAKETLKISKMLKKMIGKDILNRKDIILCGDTNSYENHTINYFGKGKGQKQSKIITTLVDLALVDIFRVLNLNAQEFTFRTAHMQSRLDQFWISTTLIKSILETGIGEHDQLLSDQSAILLQIAWNYKR